MTTSESPHTSQSSKQSRAPASRPAQAQVTVFIECTNTHRSDINTGIQRVVRNVIRNAPDVAAHFNMRIVPVILENARFVTLDAEAVLVTHQRSVVGTKQKTFGHLRNTLVHTARYLRSVAVAALPFKSVHRVLLAPPSEPGLHRLLRSTIHSLRGRSASTPAGLLLDEADGLTQSTGEPDHTGDILLLLDASWTVPLWNATRAFKRQGGTVIGVIYDLIPASHPHLCMPQLTATFSEWIREYCLTADGTIAISKSIQKQYEAYVQLCFAGKPSVLRAPVSYFHLGSDLDLADKAELPSPEIQKLFSRKVPTFLMVGTIDPRKNHAFVLDAFDSLWQSGHDVRLVLVGKQAWRTDELLTRISEHPRLGKDLFLYRDASDAELEQFYLGASALIIASEIEGFGLPVVEAFRRKLPVLCSDIPVFREIGGDAVTYFDLEDPASLAVTVAGFGQSSNIPSDVSPTWLTWHESTQALFQSLSEIVSLPKTGRPKVELPNAEPQGLRAMAAGGA